MWFFDGIWKGLKKIAGKVIEELVTFIITKVAKWIKEIIDILLGEKYDPDTSTPEETKRINQLLEKCIVKYTKESKEYDNEAKEIAKEYFKKIIDSLEDVNKIAKNEVIIEEYIFDMLNIKKEYVNKNFENIYSKEISEVFSLNNNELLDILKMEKSIEKRDRLNNLVKTTILNANKKLTSALKTSIEQEQDSIMRQLSKYINNREDLLRTSRSETEKIIKISESDKEERQKLEARYDNIIEKLDLLENLMEA